MRKNTKSRLPIIILAAIIAAVSFVIFFKGQNEEVVITPPPIRLNDTLRNEMSDYEELAKMDKTIENYLHKWNLRGASLAISRNDSLLYAKGYGWADEEKEVKMGPNHILRMASVSKLVTAIGIMKMQEDNLLTIKDTVFGPQGILCDSTYCSWIKDKKIYDITIEHLLRHQGGFSRDPMFSSLDVMGQLQLTEAPTNDDFLKVTLRRPVRFKPGEWQRYSNLGYMILSKIIERKSGLSYEEYIQKNVLEPAGCFDFHIANNYYEEKFDNEVRYYTHEGDGKYIEEYNKSGKIVERCYGGNNINGLTGAGAWCGSPAELCRLVSTIDGDDTIPDILSKESIGAMTEYFDPDTYSLGWNDTKANGTWTRTGTLAGTSALVKRFPDGECWVMITNTSTWRGPGFTSETGRLFDKCREQFSALLPKKDMFH
jgi:CubicO group peptidase (beta-lactamase class C family)